MGPVRSELSRSLRIWQVNLALTFTFTIGYHGGAAHMHFEVLLQVERKGGGYVHGGAVKGQRQL